MTDRRDDAHRDGTLKGLATHEIADERLHEDPEHVLKVARVEELVGLITAWDAEAADVAVGIDFAGKYQPRPVAGRQRKDMVRYERSSDYKCSLHVAAASAGLGGGEPFNIIYATIRWVGLRGPPGTPRAHSWVVTRAE